MSNFTNLIPFSKVNKSELMLLYNQFANDPPFALIFASACFLKECKLGATLISMQFRRNNEIQTVAIPSNSVRKSEVHWTLRSLMHHTNELYPGPLILKTRKPQMVTHRLEYSQNENIALKWRTFNQIAWTNSYKQIQ